jgi:hypothetical protein
MAPDKPPGVMAVAVDVITAGTVVVPGTLVRVSVLGL